MMLSGNLSDWSVGDLLQMLHITKKTASLHIDGTDRSGVVHFESGAIVNAEYRGEVFDDVAAFHGDIKIIALKEEWGRLLLNFEDIAIT